jgi:hypothetical protein
VGTAVAEYELVSIGRRPRHAKRTNRPARTGRILHHHLLTENFAHALSNDARRDVARATGSKWNNQSERPRRIGLSARDMCYGSECGRTRDQMQKRAAGRFHEPTPRSILVEHPLDLIRVGCFRQRKREQDRCFLRAQVVKATTVVAHDEPFGDARTSPFFGRPSFISEVGARIVVAATIRETGALSVCGRDGRFQEFDRRPGASEARGNDPSRSFL